jgi:hypothetical protein
MGEGRRCGFRRGGGAWLQSNDGDAQGGGEIVYDRGRRHFADQSRGSYPADWASPTNDPALPFEHIGFTVPWNMSEQPAASINCGFSASGMPIGLQIVGPRHADLLVLKLSRAFEEWAGTITHWPEPSLAV